MTLWMGNFHHGQLHMAGLDDMAYRLLEASFLVFPLGDSLEIRVSKVEVVD